MNEKVYLIFDIETNPIPYETFSDSQQEYLIRGAKTEEEIERKKGEMALAPLTGQVVTIGMKIVPFSQVESQKKAMHKKYKNVTNVIDSDDTYIDAANEYEDTEDEENENEFPEKIITQANYFKQPNIVKESTVSFGATQEESVVKSVALMTNPNLAEDDEPIINKEESTTFYQTTEKRVLEIFWKTVEKYKGCVLISFNGRNFDAPFLMLRSAILGVKPSRNLMEGTKFSYANHIDLLDELTFYTPSSYGATRRFNFDFYTRAFGLQSPKGEGIDGSLVSVFYNNGDYKTIANYCLRDVDATWKLFLRINEYLYIR